MKTNLKENLLEALEKSMGVISIACKACKLDRRTYYNWISKDAEFKAKVDEILESQVDFAEASLLKAINNGDTTAIIFYLKTKGKHRGYQDKQVIETDGEIKIKFGNAN